MRQFFKTHWLIFAVIITLSACSKQTNEKSQPQIDASGHPLPIQKGKTGNAKPSTQDARDVIDLYGTENTQDESSNEPDEPENSTNDVKER